MNLGVDAINLAADRRGMGRVVRQTLEGLSMLGATPALIVRDRAAAQRLQTEIAAPVVLVRDMLRHHFDAVWYPWNGMRFAPRAPSIVTIHDLFAFSFPHRNIVARVREQGPIGRALRCADTIFAVSHWTAAEIARIAPHAAARVRVVHNGVSRFFHPVQPSFGGYFFFLGGKEPRKNAGMLLRAYAAAFGEDGPPLYIAGELNEDDSAFLQSTRFKHKHFMPDDVALRDLYSGAIAVLVPSLAEGYGLPAAEAMACGAPVIASNTSALPETCGDAAVLIDPNDEAAWAGAMQELHRDDTLRDALRERGLARAAQMDAFEGARALVQAVSGAHVVDDRP